MSVTMRSIWGVSFLLVVGCGSDAEPTPLSTDLLPVTGTLPELEPPLTGEETQRLRTGFDWNSVDPLPETDPDGRPALFYRLVYVEDSKQEQILDLLDVPSNVLPLFPEERARWAGMSGVFTTFGDGEGHFRFAVMPGAVFNALRQEALDGNTVFPAVVERPVPVAEATYPNSALRYEYLVDQGFRYSGRQDASNLSTSDGVGAAREAFLLEFILLLASSHDARDGVDDAIASVDREVRGEVELTAAFRVHHTDADFGGPAAEWERAVRPGVPFRLSGVPMVAQSAMGTIRAPTNADGEARMNIAKGQSYTLCARGQNRAASVSHSDRPVHLCTFEASGDFMTGGALEFVAPEEAVVHTLRVSDYHFNLIAGMSEARAYVREQFGYTPSRSAGILIGPAADAFGAFNGDRAFALCGGYNTFAVHSIAAVLGFFDSLIEPFGITSFRIAGHDIAFPSAGSEVATHSRLVPAHEYGHFLMCDLISARGYEKITEFLFDVVWTTLTTTQAPGVSNLTMLEGFADWFASRVAGGLNYFALASGTPDTNGRDSATGAAYYCDPAAPVCLEDNVGGMGQQATLAGFDQVVAQVTTLMHDAFDGEVSGGRSVGIGAYYSWDGTVFQRTGTDRHQRDEDVALAATDLLAVFDNWASRHNTVTVDNMFNAIATTALQRGFSPTQVCELFGIHEPTNDCTQLVDTSALDTRVAVPVRPVILSAVPLSEDSLEVRWEDLNPFISTATDWTVMGDDGMNRSFTAPYVRTGGAQVVEGLTPDTLYEVGVANVNGTATSPHARTTAVTLAEPVSIPRLVAGPGEMQVSWDAVLASSYLVEIEGDGPRRIAATVSGTSAVVSGLTEGIDYTFRVISANQLGEQSAPSAPATGQVMMPEVVFVSARVGNDTSGTGSEMRPYRSFDAAMAAAERLGVTVLRLEEGSYSSSTAHTLTGNWSIEGGFRIAGSAFVRQAAGVRSSLFLAGGTGADGCTSAGFFHFRLGRAAIVVSSAGALQTRGMVLENNIASRSACTTAIHLEGGDYVAEDTIIRGDFAFGTADCAVALQGRAVSGDRPNVTLRNSQLVGQTNNTTAAGVLAAGLCLESPAAVRIEDTLIAATGGSYPSTGSPASLVGAVIGGSQNTVITRSLLASRSTPRQGPGATALSRGYIAGLEVSSGAVLRIDNSVLFTHGGGTTNRAADVGSTSGSLRSFFAYQNVFNAGGDWRQQVTPPSEIQGAGLNLRGDLSNAEIGLVNNTFTYAAGVRSVMSTSVFAGIDRQQTTSDPRRLRVLGNVFSLPLLSSNLAGYVLCGDGEFERISTETGLNRATSHRCESSTDSGTWVTTANRTLASLARDDLNCTAACPAGQYCQSTACIGRNAGRMLSFEPSGYPQPVDLPFVFGMTGVALSGLPHTSEILRDRSGRARTDGVNGVGAFLR